jgi:glutaredoxin
MRFLRGILPMAALVAAAAATGWFGTLAVRQLRPAPAVLAGDYGSIVAAASRPVVLFATRSCGYCEKARVLLATLGVDYAELDIEASGRARALYAQLDVGGVPVLVAPGWRIVGYDEAAYRAWLAPAPVAALR